MSPNALIIRFTAQNNIMSASYPERNFGGNQLLDGSMRICSRSDLQLTIVCRLKLLVLIDNLLSLRPGV